MGIQATSCAVGVLLLVTAPSARGDDWPQWRGPNRDGVSTETGWLTRWPKSGPRKLWRKKVGIGYATVSVVGERVYTMGNDGRNDVVWCLDAESGKEIWKRSYACRGGGGGWPGARIAPTIDGDRLYTLSLKGHIHCLDARTGKVVWSRNTAKDLGAKGGRHGFACHPVIDGKRIFFELGARGGSVVAFDKTSGKVLWQGGRHRVGHSSPVVYKQGKSRTLVVFTGSALVGMDPQSGKELWRFRTKNQYDCNIATPIISGDRIFISSVYYDKGSTLLSMARGKPKVVRHTKKMQNHCTSCVLWKGHLYGFDGWVDTKGGKGVLKCMELKTGRVKWSRKGFGTGGVMVADGKLLIQGDRGELAVAEASPQRFKLLSRAKVLNGRCWNMPVLSGGRIYCRSWEGLLVCLDVRAK